MPFVLDASVAGSWWLPDELSERAGEVLLLMRQQKVVVPPVWWFEVRNLLIINERRGRIDARSVDAALRTLGELGIEVDQSPEEQVLVRLARHHRLTAYDASYLELAARRRIGLATLDHGLRRAAEAEGVGLL